MKKLLLPSVLLFAVILFAGCDKFNDERFSTTIITDLHVTIDDNSGAIDIQLDSTLTSMINSELQAHKEEIEKYELVEIRYNIWEFIGDDGTTFDGTLGFGNTNSDTPGVSYTFSSVDLKVNNENPAAVVMSFNSSEIDKIQQYFLDTNGMKIYLSGNVSDAPISFILQVVVDVDAIANVKK